MLTLIFVVVVTALVFEYINGFHDTANSIATVVSTKVLTPRQAVLLAAFTNLIGALWGYCRCKDNCIGVGRNERCYARSDSMRTDRRDRVESSDLVLGAPQQFQSCFGWWPCRSNCCRCGSLERSDLVTAKQRALVFRKRASVESRRPYVRLAHRRLPSGDGNYVASVFAAEKMEASDGQSCLW